MFHNAAQNSKAATPPIRSEDKARIQSVQRALRLLQHFTYDTYEWGVTDLSRQMMLPKSIVFRLLTTLEGEGFVEQNVQTQKYRLGRMVFRIAAIYSSQNDLIRVGQHYLGELASKTRLAAEIGILDGAQYMCLYSLPSRELMGIQLRPGDRRPAHATAAGKVLLAGLGDDAARALFPDGKLEQVTPNTITDKDLFFIALEKAREQGYAINRDESFVGLTSVAAPIRNYQGVVVAALSLSGPTHIIGEDQIQHLAQYTIQASDGISYRLGDVLVPRRR